MHEIAPNVSLSLDPHYTLSHELEPDTDTFLIARQASDIILDNPRSRVSHWTDYLGIRVKPENTTSMFRGALGDAVFDRVDLRKKTDATGNRMSLILHDAVNAGRIIRLTQTDPAPDYNHQDFEVIDSAKDTIRDFPFPIAPASNLVWEQDVHDWLQLQVFGKHEPPVEPLSTEALFDHLARHTTRRKEKTTAALVLSATIETGTSQFIAHRERLIDEDMPHKPYLKNSYWAWLATDMPVIDARQSPIANTPHADFVITRTLAHFNGNNLIGPGTLNNRLTDVNNRICFDMEAADIHDPVALTRLGLQRKHRVLDSFKRTLHKAQLFDYATRS